MTGVGFLGAGVIFKEGVSVQGLTTAACIWAVAAVGLLFGVGLYGPGALLTFLILVVLIGLRAVEGVLPHRVYALATFVFERELAPDQAALETMLGAQEFKLYDVSYASRGDGKLFEFSANLVSNSESSFAAAGGAAGSRGRPGWWRSVRVQAQPRERSEARCVLSLMLCSTCVASDGRLQACADPAKEAEDGVAGHRQGLGRVDQTRLQGGGAADHRDDGLSGRHD